MQLTNGVLYCDSQMKIETRNGRNEKLWSPRPDTRCRTAGVRPFPSLGSSALTLEFSDCRFESRRRDRPTGHTHTLPKCIWLWRCSPHSRIKCKTRTNCRSKLTNRNRISVPFSLTGCLLERSGPPCPPNVNIFCAADRKLLIEIFCMIPSGPTRCLIKRPVPPHRPTKLELRSCFR